MGAGLVVGHALLDFFPATRTIFSAWNHTNLARPLRIKRISGHWH